MNTWRVGVIRYNGVRTQKATDFWRVISGAEIEDSTVRVSSLPLPRIPVWIPAVSGQRRPELRSIQSAAEDGRKSLTLATPPEASSSCRTLPSPLA
jgi:hypothetical protein